MSNYANNKVFNNICSAIPGLTLQRNQRYVVALLLPEGFFFCRFCVFVKLHFTSYTKVWFVVSSFYSFRSMSYYGSKWSSSATQ